MMMMNPSMAQLLASTIEPILLSRHKTLEELPQMYIQENLP